MTINLDYETIEFRDKTLKEIASHHTKYELEVLRQVIDKKKPHSAIREYFKSLSANMAFVLHHLKSVNDGFSEYDDQLSIKLKNLKEKEQKLKLKLGMFLNRCDFI